MDEDVELLEAETSETELPEYKEDIQRLHEDLVKVQEQLSLLQTSDDTVDLTELYERMNDLQLFLSTNLSEDGQKSLYDTMAAIEEQLVTIQEYQGKIHETEETEEESETDGLYLETKSSMEIVVDDLESINANLEEMLIYQKNQQNVLIPMMAGVALIFGGVLALVLARYFKH